jgi:hypothetical protein
MFGQSLCIILPNNKGNAIMASAKTTATSAVITPAANGFASASVMKWAAIFPAASLALFVVQPAFQTSATFAVGLMALQALLAHLSVSDSDAKDSFESKQLAISLLAPMQFAFMMWAAVHMGRELAGASLTISSLAALAVLSGAMLVDAVLSTIMLLASGRGTAGTSVASLISAKYAGLLGQVH